MSNYLDNIIAAVIDGGINEKLSSIAILWY